MEELKGVGLQTVISQINLDAAWMKGVDQRTGGLKGRWAMSRISRGMAMRGRYSRSEYAIGGVASVSASMRHVTPIKGSFAYKCSDSGL
jgi:hypothetical protein